MSSLHHVDAMGHPQRDMRELLDEEDADAACGKVDYRRNQPGDDHGSKPERQFVRENIAGAIYDSLGQDDHLLLSAGERSGARAELLAELGERIERRLDAVLTFAARQMMTGDPEICGARQ